MTDTDQTANSGYFSDDAATFGDRVAAGRRQMGLTQQELGANLGIKLKTLRAWEDDISEPRANKLQMLAGFLGVSLVWLMTGQGEGVKDPDAMLDELDSVSASDTKNLLDELRGIRTSYSALGRRLALLEKRLRNARDA